MDHSEDFDRYRPFKEIDQDGHLDCKLDEQLFLPGFFICKWTAPKAVIRRLHLATGTGTYEELAIWLGIERRQISEAVKTGIIPLFWLQVMILKGIDHNPLWILAGEGSIMLVENRKV